MSDTRARLVTATNELFRRHGYNGTNIKEVTATAEATTGSLYHFFPRGKAELAAAVLIETGATYQALFEAIAADAETPAEAIGAFFDGAADVLATTDFIDVCPIGTVAREVASTDDGLRSAADQAFTGWVDSLTHLLERHGHDRTAATAISITVIAALEGGFVLARTRRDADLLRGIGREMQKLVGTATSAPSFAVTEA
jgi:AcrR family transcriptional regulator